MLLLSQAGTLLSWLLFLMAFTLPRGPLLEINAAVTGQFTLTLPLLVLIGARALDGLTGGNVSVANAYLADVTTERDRAAAFGKMAVSSNLGFVVGPARPGPASWAPPPSAPARQWRPRRSSRSAPPWPFSGRCPNRTHARWDATPNEGASGSCSARSIGTVSSAVTRASRALTN